MSAKLPRIIRPEMIDLGDTIRVAFPVGLDGIQRSRVGRVHRRDYEGSLRVLYTRENGRLLEWVPGSKGPRITLIAREPAEQPPLFTDSSFDHLAERYN